jgi:hypothetical protein
MSRERPDRLLSASWIDPCRTGGRSRTFERAPYIDFLAAFCRSVVGGTMPFRRK